MAASQAAALQAAQESNKAAYEAHLKQQQQAAASQAAALQAAQESRRAAYEARIRELEARLQLAQAMQAMQPQAVPQLSAEAPPTQQPAVAQVHQLLCMLAHSFADSGERSRQQLRVGTMRTETERCALCRLSRAALQALQLQPVARQLRLLGLLLIH